MNRSDMIIIIGGKLGGMFELIIVAVVAVVAVVICRGQNGGSCCSM